MSQWKLTIPRAATLSVPIDFKWADDKSSRDVSGNTADLVLHLSTDNTVALRQDALTLSRKWLDTTETTYAAASGPCAAEIVLKLNGTVVDRLFGTMKVEGA